MPSSQRAIQGLCLVTAALFIAAGLAQGAGPAGTAAHGAGELLFLPLAARGYPPPPPTATPTSPPSAIQWSGTTSRGHPMSFKVSVDGGQWTDFELTTDLAAPDCSVSYSELTVKAAGPGSIAGGFFGEQGGVFSFTGQLDSPTAAHGTYSFSNYPFVVGLSGPPFVCIYYLTQSGTWNAGPAPAAATPTPTSTATQTPTATPSRTPTPTSTTAHAATATRTATPTPTLTSAHAATITPTPTRTWPYPATSTPTRTPTVTATPVGHHPEPGLWSGTTSRGQGMAFTVSGDSAQWSLFDLITDYSSPSCGVNGQVEQLVPGPGAISGNHFSYADATFSFSGEFSSDTAASGTYSFTGYQVVIGIPYPPYVCIYYLTQSGTWAAHAP